jgi:hypothetical protein
MLTAQRVSSGSYQIKSKLGITTITKETTDKWWIDFPTGKRSYRRSYSSAKAFAISHLEKCLVSINEQEKVAKTSKNTENSLMLRLQQNGAYVCGAEAFGCINSGMNACILHMVVNQQSYYLVGKESDITDIMFEKNALKIKKNIAVGIVEDYRCKNGRVINVYRTFKPAEKAYKALNDAMLKANQKARQTVAKARQEKDYFTLNDYGLV